MLHSDRMDDETYRKENFTTCTEDRPLVVQLCGNDPQILLKAAKMVESHCDAIDINLGCPQTIAKKGNFGAFLMDDFERVKTIVETLSSNLSVPLFCKIRVFPSHTKTIDFAMMLENAGCRLLCVHGRTKELKKPVYRDGRHAHADWDLIRKIKSKLKIPVISNGSIQYFEDIQRCLDSTGADGIMSAVSILSNPGFFSGKIPDPFNLSFEYLEICRVYPAPLPWIRVHLWKILQEYLSVWIDLRDRLYDNTKSIDDIEAVIKDVQIAVQAGRSKTTKHAVPLRQVQEDLEEILDSTNFFVST
eukprot:TRINITY_DN8789_c0_g1_i1.p1 TRINITY_DN8789_c0_g1~~TRINITY_DN8789_c0_g1_i1.p1  ORF type:complete len:303 (-),score=86.22 TRINITY_DN8789_c0_g1_i1:81-989(-)